ncbi:hypothetical protein GT022_20040 [Agaribacter marinus]|uniref:Uncharacterized protein n=1 Tax=Virgibacillus salarius TaxID=447199 RepID=A0A941DX09_9BACI|nr:hypothetical protein [Virgibacillus salarius]MBR7798295.1 hypothetical protein [Virgibacillus salarius]NAZ11004.1 hypothetical protein [Agaribacter marinus]
MLSKFEQETIILFNDEEETATVSTLSSKVAERIKKAGYEPEMLDKDSYKFTLSKHDLRILGTDRKAIRLARRPR